MSFAKSSDVKSLTSCDERSRELCNYFFFALSYSGFQFSGISLGTWNLENRELICWDLPDRGLHARPTAPATRPFSSISLRIRRFCIKCAELPAAPPPQPVTAVGERISLRRRPLPKEWSFWYRQAPAITSEWKYRGWYFARSLSWNFNTWNCC